MRLESSGKRSSSVGKDTTSLCPEIAARLNQALDAKPAAGKPSSYARPVYDVLVEHGLGRSDLLAIAASLMDLVAADVKPVKTGNS